MGHVLTSPSWRVPRLSIVSIGHCRRSRRAPRLGGHSNPAVSGPPADAQPALSPKVVVSRHPSREVARIRATLAGVRPRAGTVVAAVCVALVGGLLGPVGSAAASATAAGAAVAPSTATTDTTSATSATGSGAPAAPYAVELRAPVSVRVTIGTREQARRAIDAVLGAQRAADARRGIEQALAIGIVARPAQQGADRVLYFVRDGGLGSSCLRHQMAVHNVHGKSPVREFLREFCRPPHGRGLGACGDRQELSRLCL